MSLEDDLSSFEPLVYTEILSSYLLDRFKERVEIQRGLQDPTTQTTPPLKLNVEIVCKCEYIFKEIFYTYSNNVGVTWDVERCGDRIGKRPSGLNEKTEAAIAKEYPPISYPGMTTVQTKPLTVVDMNNKIILWYLPKILSPKRRGIMWESTKHLDALLCNNYLTGSQGKGWRINHTLFRSPSSCEVHPGFLNLSPAWFHQGHQSRTDSLHVSASLQAGSRTPSVNAWLRDFYQSSALMSAILRVIHLKLYDAGRLALTRLMLEDEEVWDVLKVWPSVYSVMSVISNRLTPPHWGTQSQASWYDLLATVGLYPDAVMELPGLGLRLSYMSGRLWGLLGYSFVTVCPPMMVIEFATSTI
ncbi:hypothetical protein JAAARDRAFT_194866 [Jaapia argillacea MUCL 33604]|uniref:Uncharacterized protein n=1 Tax=Jaapia argillacea MUCL 33604 TaxID=933084 RepID=A0A067PQ74_9AGAM|nr:hypothetical protein JAAARDRAFT_194866 [Jaapia argillacea MUCL 33604]